jgi:hypothetical protein
VRLPEAILLLARAIEGDEDALRAVLDLEDVERLAAGHRLAPALALRARSAWVENPILQTWKRDLLWVAGRWLALREGLVDLSRVLGAEGIPWFPIKGGDLAFRVYDSAEERPAGDLDVLVPAEQAERALKALLESGTRHFLPPGRHGLDFVRNEGYNYQLVQPVGTILELHFRLWGIVPEQLPAALIAVAEPDPTLGPTGLRLPLAHAFVVAAVHHWNSDPPHPLLGLWDLRKIMQATESDIIDEVVGFTKRWGLELPVAAAALVAASAWDDERCLEVAERLEPELRVSERLALSRLRRSNDGWISLGTVFGARLLARRPSRSGWRAPLRRLWPHPGIVEHATPDGWPWWRRRLAYTFGMKSPQRNLRRA